MVCGLGFPRPQLRGCAGLGTKAFQNYDILSLMVRPSFLRLGGSLGLGKLRLYKRIELMLFPLFFCCCGCCFCGCGCGCGRAAPLWRRLWMGRRRRRYPLRLVGAGGGGGVTMLGPRLGLRSRGCCGCGLGLQLGLRPWRLRRCCWGASCCGATCCGGLRPWLRLRRWRLRPWCRRFVLWRFVFW